jgi:ribosomal protein L3 glutamine methyltransferase
MTPEPKTIIALIDQAAEQLTRAGVAFGHGTHNAFDEAAWLVLWRLGLPLDAALDGPESIADQPVDAGQRASVAALLRMRIDSRKPAAYLTHEAWLQGGALLCGRARHRAAQFHCRTAGRWQPGPVAR